MNIPAPSQQYDSYDYSYGGASLRQNEASGAGYGGGMGEDPSMDVYKQQLAQYIQQAQIELSHLQQGTPEYEQDLAYYQQALEYAQQVGLQVQPMQGMGQGMGNEFDPLNNRGTAGYSVNPSYQDSSKIVYEDVLPAMTADRKDLREEHFYAPPYDFTVPGAATAVASNEVDPNHPDKTRVCVAVTWPDGTVKKHYFYNVDWKDTGLTLRSTSPENQITLDPSLAGNTHVTTAEIGGSNSASQAGDPPTKMDGDKRVYDGQSFDISPVAEGSNKETKVMASGDVTITPNSNEEYYVMDYQNGKYVVKVYASEEDKTHNKIKETITIDGALVDKVHFVGDPSRIEFGGALKNPTDAHALNDSKEANNITLESGDEESTNLTDTPPSSKEGNKAFYDDPEYPEVEIYANHDDTTEIHEIWASTSATIHGASNRDKASLEYDAATDVLTVKVYKNGDLNSTPEVFIVNNAKETAITLNVMGESSLVNTSDEAKALVRVGLDGEAPTDKTAESTVIVDTLIQLTNTNEAQLLSQLQASGYDYKTIEDLNKAIKDGHFPPRTPDKKLIKFLAAIDGTFDGLYKELKRNGKDGALRGQAANRLVELLQALYPDHMVRQTYPNANSETGAHLMDDITFDGQNYHWFNEQTNTWNAGELNFYAI